MGKYILKRVISLIPVLLIMSFLVFMLIHLIPGDPAKVILGDEATFEEIEALRRQMGLNEPLLIQYVTWLGRVLTGNLGESIFMRQPIVTIIARHIVPTIQLTVYSMLIAFVIALPLGMLAAKNKGNKIDQGISSLAMAGISMPSFLLSLLMVMFIAVDLGWLPPSGYQPMSKGIMNNLRYMILPAFALGMVETGLLIRMTRSSLLDVMQSDYIKMARAKGVSERTIIVKHALKNAALPILTVMAQSTIAALAGATVIETIFNIPGIGQLIINSVTRRDYDLIQGIVLVVATTKVLMFLLVDILYKVIDPRIKFNQ